MRRLLFIGAHPDDETFFAAGTLAKCVEEQVRVAVICATRGERGSTADLCTIEKLPSVREAEMRHAMQILGVQGLHFLPYEDQKLASAPVEEIRRQLVEIIRKERPDVVITFDPNGTNQHTDHVAISRFALDALAAAGDPRWFPDLGSPHTVARVLWPPPTIIFRYPEAVDLPNEPGIDFLIDTTQWSDKKSAAIRAHKTQRLGRLFFDDPNGRRTFCSEAFRVGGGPRPAKIPSGDLFAELRPAL